MGFFLTPHIFYDRIWQMIESYNTRHFLTQKREDMRIKSTLGNMNYSTAPLPYCCNFRFTQHILHFIFYYQSKICHISSIVPNQKINTFLIPVSFHVSKVNYLRIVSSPLNFYCHGSTMPF